VVESKVHHAEHPRQVLLKQRCQEAAEISASTAAAIQLLLHGFLLFFCFAWGQEEAKVGFSPGLLSSPASGIAWGALLAGAGRREGCFSQGLFVRVCFALQAIVLSVAAIT